MSVTTEAKREALYSRLQEVLGYEPATTLMAMYTGEPATKTDLYEVRDELRAEFRSGISSVRSELSEMRTDIREIRSAMQSNARTYLVTQTSTVLAVAAIVRFL